MMFKISTRLEKKFAEMKINLFSFFTLLNDEKNPPNKYCHWWQSRFYLMVEKNVNSCCFEFLYLFCFYQISAILIYVKVLTLNRY